MTLKRKLGIFFGLLVVIVLIALLPWSKHVVLGNGGALKITKAPFWRALFPEANTKILYTPKNGKAGNIVLWQDVFDGPVFLFPGNETNVLLCLYDFDVDYRLFRIDTRNSFKSVPTNSELKHILFTCDWVIEDGTANDWQEVLHYLQNVPGNVFARQSIPVDLRFNVTPESILKRLAYQGIKLETNRSPATSRQ